MVRAGATKIPPYLVCCGLALVPWLAACGSEAAAGGSEADTGLVGENAPGACPDADATESITPEARVDVIATGQGYIGTLSPLGMPALVADASGVYWQDTSGGVYARQVDGGVVTLQPPEDSAVAGRWHHVVGITADAERVYVGNAFVEAAIDYLNPLFLPPGRLLAYPKDGGPAQLLLELEDRTIYPVATDGARLITFVWDTNGNGGFYQVDLTSLQLERLEMSFAPNGYMQLSGAALYWSDLESPPNLLRTGFDDPSPEVVRGLLSNDFSVGPGYMLSRDERFQTLVLHGAATDPDRPLPGTGELISFDRALDARHVYWFAYRYGNDGRVSSKELVRANVVCGILEHLATPGLVPDSSAEILGQYGDTLYIKNGYQLFAVQKP